MLSYFSKALLSRGASTKESLPTLPAWFYGLSLSLFFLLILDLALSIWIIARPLASGPIALKSIPRILAPIFQINTPPAPISPPLITVAPIRSAPANSLARYNDQALFNAIQPYLRKPASVPQSYPDHRITSADTCQCPSSTLPPPTDLVNDPPPIIRDSRFILPIHYRSISRGMTKTHTGIDYVAPTGTEVVAAADGKVISADHAGWNGGWGTNIVIDHGQGKKTRYAHLSRIAVTVGQVVHQGELIAYSGSTGRSTGPHLHFEMRINGKPVYPYI